MKDAVEAKGIKHLCHFTNMVNLDSIMTNGIIPRDILEANNSPMEYNDDYRFDNLKNANCLSISHPNYKMFYSLRQKNPSFEWVVIAVKPDVLWEKKCVFSTTNAASNQVTQLPHPERLGKEAFNNMFLPVQDKPTREALQLPNNYPTNPQAEVLVLDIITPDYFLGLAVHSEKNALALQARYPGIKILCGTILFSPRFDYASW